MKNPDNGWEKRRLAKSITRGNSTMDGRRYADITFDRCRCRNSKRADEALCDRCQQLKERGFLTRG